MSNFIEENFPFGGYIIQTSPDDTQTTEITRQDFEFDIPDKFCLECGHPMWGQTKCPVCQAKAGYGFDSSDHSAWNTQGGGKEMEGPTWTRNGPGKTDFECKEDYRKNRWEQEATAFIKQEEKARRKTFLWDENGRKLLSTEEATLLKQRRNEREETFKKLLAWVEQTKNTKDLNRKYWQYRRKIDKMYKAAKTRIDGGFRYWVPGIDAKLTKTQVKAVFEAFRQKRGKLSDIA